MEYQLKSVTLSRPLEQEPNHKRLAAGVAALGEWLDHKVADPTSLMTLSWLRAFAKRILPMCEVEWVVYSFVESRRLRVVTVPDVPGGAFLRWDGFDGEGEVSGCECTLLLPDGVDVHMRQKDPQLVGEFLTMARQLATNERPPAEETRWSKVDTPDAWARHFGVSTRTFSRWIKNGKIRAKVIDSKNIMVDLRDLPTIKR